MTFAFFDREHGVDVTYRRLPQWFQPGVTYFLTFRTADSLPADVLRQWLQERGAWLQRHGIAPDAPDWRQALQRLPAALRNDFHGRFTEAFHNYLDAGYGECLLKRPELAAVVARTLLHFDGQRYHLGDFVVMPNHVHLLVCLLGETDLLAQTKSWKRYSSTQINHCLGRQGHFWQAESFDHLVRSPEQFAHFQRYIADNPKKAGLREGEFLLSLEADRRKPAEQPRGGGK
jgi:putative transposase